LNISQTMFADENKSLGHVVVHFALFVIELQG